MTIKLSLRDLFPLHEFDNDELGDEVLSIDWNLAEVIRRLRSPLSDYDQGDGIKNDSLSTRDTPFGSDVEDSDINDFPESESEASESSSQGSEYRPTNSKSSNSTLTRTTRSK